MTNLVMSRIKTGIVKKPRRIMLYGVHGIGKSSWGAAAPSAIFLQIEEGLNDIDCDKFPLAKTYDDVVDSIGALYTEKHKYKTVVIDTLDWLEKLIHVEVCKKKGKEDVKNIEDIGYAKGYTYALDWWKEILDGLSALRDEKGMTIILIAHSEIKKFDNPETDSYDRFTPRLNKHASALIGEWVDEILFAGYKVYTKQTDEGFERKKTKALGTGERVLKTTERPAHVAKNRLNLPAELPLEWDAYAKYINVNGTKTKKGAK